MQPEANSSVWSRSVTLTALNAGLAALLALLPWGMAQAVAPGTWSPSGNMTSVRFNQTATLLPNGRILVAGGCIDPRCTSTASAELYDPYTGNWTATGTLATPRSAHTATLLPNGQVLVAGGCNGYPSCQALYSAETYNSATGTWAPAGTMNSVHAYQTATLLHSGLVLVAGGKTCNPACSSVLTSAELYNYWTGRWYAINSMNDPRYSQTATLLADGRVLLAGGTTACTSTCSATASAELYDPHSGRFSLTGSMNVARTGAAATRLRSGLVLVTGGCPSTDLYNNCTNPLNSAELYDPYTGRWTLTGSMASARYYHTSTLLDDGQVLIAAGTTSSAELYEPLTNRFVPTGSLPLVTYLDTATLLHSGKVLVVGGCSGNPYSCTIVASAETYTP